MRETILPRSTVLVPDINGSAKRRMVATGSEVPADIRRATSPATCGDAIDVPLNEREPPPIAFDVMSTPGA